MKIIEVLKKIKHLDRKTEKNQERISEWCSYSTTETNPETPNYNAEELRAMIQQIGDWQTEKARLRHILHKTNIETNVEFDGKFYNIDQLLLIQSIILPSQLKVLKSLSRQRKDSDMYGYNSHIKEEKKKIIMQYEPRERDISIDKVENIMTKLNDLLDQLSITIDVKE